MTTEANIDNSVGLVPSPTSARAELPTQATVDAAGINLQLAEARLVLTVISGFISRGDSKPFGTILGAAGGAILGRSIDRHNNIVCR